MDLLSSWIPKLFSFVYYVSGRLGKSSGPDATSAAGKYHQAWGGRQHCETKSSYLHCLQSVA